jgi:hypothetical protein
MCIPSSDCVQHVVYQEQDLTCQLQRRLEMTGHVSFSTSFLVVTLLYTMLFRISKERCSYADPVLLPSVNRVARYRLNLTIRKLNNIVQMYLPTQPP